MLSTRRPNSPPTSRKSSCASRRDVKTRSKHVSWVCTCPFSSCSLKQNKTKQKMTHPLPFCFVAVCSSVYQKRTIIFCNQKITAHRIMLVMTVAGFKAGELHGDMNQIRVCPHLFPLSFSLSLSLSLSSDQWMEKRFEEIGIFGLVQERPA